MSDFFDPNTVAALTKRLNQAAREGRKAGQKRALPIAGRVVLDASNAEVPHEEGDFERGGGVTVNEEGTVAAIAYHDTAFTGQAKWLHENMEINHDPGRNAKFLERALNSTADQVQRIVGTEVKRGMGT